MCSGKSFTELTGTANYVVLEVLKPGGDRVERLDLRGPESTDEEADSEIGVSRSSGTLLSVFGRRRFGHRKEDECQSEDLVEQQAR